MSRKARVISSTDIYHITLRSVNQQVIFEEEADYYKYLDFLTFYKEKYQVEIYAYCLMENHIHILASVSAANMSLFFQCLSSQFARWYNVKYERYGHLFQERFFSKPVESQAYFLTSLVYIHNNPVKAGICQFISDYKWSSAKFYFDQKNPLINTTYAYNMLGSKDSLLHYFATHSATFQDEEKTNEDEIIIPSKRKFLSDEKALQKFQSITKLNSPSDIQQFSRDKRNYYIRLLSQNDYTQKQISALCGVSRATVQRICR